jgi:hypothetical protein
MFRRLFHFLSKDIAMDLGTANTLLYTRAQGIVINEPSVVAIDVQKNVVLAVGAAAKDYLGRTPQRIRAVRPMKDGVIADFDVTREMISYFVRKAITGLRLVKPSMVICIPTGITQVRSAPSLIRPCWPALRTWPWWRSPWPPPSALICPCTNPWQPGAGHRRRHQRGGGHYPGGHRQRPVRTGGGRRHEHGRSALPARRVSHGSGRKYR